MNQQQRKPVPSPHGRQQALTIEILFNLLGMEWLIALTKNKMWILSPSFWTINQFSQSAIVLVKYFATQSKRGIPSPSSPNNQPVLSINKCIDQLLLVNPKWNLCSFLSQQSTNTVNQQMHQLATAQSQGVFFLPLPTFNQYCWSMKMLIDYISTW